MCPTFNFECSECGYKLERFVRITYPKKSECPKCHKQSLIRCIGTGGGFIFKGDGWTNNNKQISDAIKENNKMNQEKLERSREDADY